MQSNDERTEWMKGLKDLQEENVRLKMMLSGLILRGVKPDILVKIETFYNRFLGIDSAVSGVKLKISIQQVITEQEVMYYNKENMLAVKHEKIKKEIKKIENDFASLVKDFNQFIVDTPGIS